MCQVVKSIRSGLSPVDGVSIVFWSKVCRGRCADRLEGWVIKCIPKETSLLYPGRLGKFAHIKAGSRQVAETSARGVAHDSDEPSPQRLGMVEQSTVSSVTLLEGKSYVPSEFLETYEACSAVPFPSAFSYFF